MTLKGGRDAAGAGGDRLGRGKPQPAIGALVSRRRGATSRHETRHRLVDSPRRSRAPPARLVLPGRPRRFEARHVDGPVTFGVSHWRCAEMPPSDPRSRAAACGCAAWSAFQRVGLAPLPIDGAVLVVDSESACRPSSAADTTRVPDMPAVIGLPAADVLDRRLRHSGAPVCGKYQRASRTHGSCGAEYRQDSRRAWPFYDVLERHRLRTRRRRQRWSSATRTWRGNLVRQQIVVRVEVLDPCSRTRWHQSVARRIAPAVGAGAPTACGRRIPR